MRDKILLKIDDVDKLNSIEMLASLAKFMSKARGCDYVKEDLENLLDEKGYTLASDRKKFFELYNSL